MIILFLKQYQNTAKIQNFFYTTIYLISSNPMIQKGEQQEQILKSRFYRDQFPKENELVMAQVLNSEENGCYVELLQYERKRGMIPLNEYSVTWKKAVHKALKVGKLQVLRVIRVDRDKGYVDLSKKDVIGQDQTEGQQKFANSKTVNSIVWHLSQSTKIPMKEIYQEFVWNLYQKGTTHPLDLMKKALLNEQKMNELGIKTQQIKEKLIAQLKRRFKQSMLKTISLFEIGVRTFDGIGTIKDILSKGAAAAKQQNYQVKIFIIGAPVYMIQVTTASKQEGKKALQIALKQIQEQTLAVNGTFNIRKKPQITGDTEAIINQIVENEQDGSGKGQQGQESDEQDF